MMAWYVCTAAGLMLQFLGQIVKHLCITGRSKKNCIQVFRKKQQHMFGFRFPLIEIYYIVSFTLTMLTIQLI